MIEIQKSVADEVEMNEMNRRDMVKLATGFALATGVSTATSAAETQDLTSSGEVKTVPKVTDEFLESVMHNPTICMLNLVHVIQLEEEARHGELIINSALDEFGQRHDLSLKPDTIKIFRANGDTDETTKQGRLQWRLKGKIESTTISQPSQVIMVIREGSDAVRFYTLEADFRC